MSLSKFYTYLYRDPKTNVLIYVGEGLKSRPFSHLKSSTNRRLGFLLKKRIAEGFNPQPEIIEADSKDDAQEMEMLLIAMIGRADLGTGTLFNNTDGGGGMRGFKPSAEKCKTHSEFLKAHPVKHWEGKKLSEAHKASIQANSGGWNQTEETKARIAKSRVGKKIFRSPTGERKLFTPGLEPLGWST